MFLCGVTRSPSRITGRMTNPNIASTPRPASISFWCRRKKENGLRIFVLSRRRRSGAGPSPKNPLGYKSDYQDYWQRTHSTKEFKDRSNSTTTAVVPEFPAVGGIVPGARPGKKGFTPSRFPCFRGMNPFFSLRPVTRCPITEVVGEAVNRGMFPPEVLRTTPPDSGYYSPK